MARLRAEVVVGCSGAARDAFDAAAGQEDAGGTEGLRAENESPLGRTRSLV